MLPRLHLYLCDDEGERFFGRGPYLLLRGVERLGSLRMAAAEMDMSYTKALGLVRRAEEALGYPLTLRTVGGKGGGGAQLTAEAEQLLWRYDCYREACAEFAQSSFERFFPAAPPAQGDDHPDG